jgi:hypothetical protein
MKACRTLTIAGAMAQKAGRGGHTWAFLQYIVGFQRLGWDVLFLDRIEPGTAMTDTGRAAPIRDSWNVQYLERVMHCFGLDGHYALLSTGGASVAGLSRPQVLKRVAESAAIINVMGVLDDHEILQAAQMRVFLDIDPGFPQMWRELAVRDALAGHDAFVTVAANIGKPDCSIPTCGLEWITTRPPIVLDEWPAVEWRDEVEGAMTTIASWRGSCPPVGYRGTMYGHRAHEFRQFAALPCLTRGRFEMALDIHPADVKDVQLLSESGWSLVEPRLAAGDPWRYRDYIRRSAAELTVSKGMYVQTRSGRFGHRSICYLASGRPVLAQDTGLDDLLPQGDGLLTFTTVEEAAEGARAIERDYVRHSRAARRLAEDYFDSSDVLTSLTHKLHLH